jgi:hypothetical protein
MKHISAEKTRQRRQKKEHRWCDNYNTEAVKERRRDARKREKEALATSPLDKPTNNTKRTGRTVGEGRGAAFRGFEVPSSRSYTVG